MNYNTNHSPNVKKIFKVVFVGIIVIAIAYFGYSNYIAKKTTNSGERFENYSENTKIVKSTDISLSEPTTEPVQTEEILSDRPNALYYINENGYISHLDERYQDYLYEMCIKYDVKEYYTLFIAQIYHESGFDENSISGTNDYGLMQINKCNHEWLGKKLGNNNFLDPYNNIEAGVYMMSNFLKKYQDVHKALVCYNRGEGAVINGTYSTSYSRGVIEDMNLLVKID